MRPARVAIMVAVFLPQSLPLVVGDLPGYVPAMIVKSARFPRAAVTLSVRKVRTAPTAPATVAVVTVLYVSPVSAR